MGKLAELRMAWQKAKIGSHMEKEAREKILEITESDWWNENVGKPFVWPKKIHTFKPLEFSEEEGFKRYGNFIVPIHEICPKCRMWKHILTTSDGEIPVVN